jgi:hypothetical protein
VAVDLGSRRIEIGEERAAPQPVDDRHLARAEAEVRQVLLRVGLELEERPHRRQLGLEPLIREVAARAEIDDRTDVELAARHGGHGDAIFDDELAVLDRECPGGPLCDDAPAQPLGLVGRESRQLGDHVDLVTAGGRREPAAQLVDLGRRHQPAGQRDAHRVVIRQRRRCPDDHALLECHRVRPPIREQVHLPGQPAQRECSQGLAPRPVRDATSCQLRHLPPPPPARDERDRSDHDHRDHDPDEGGVAFRIPPPADTQAMHFP